MDKMVLVTEVSSMISGYFLKCYAVGVDKVDVFHANEELQDLLAEIETYCCPVTAPRCGRRKMWPKCLKTRGGGKE